MRPLLQVCILFVTELCQRLWVWCLVWMWCIVWVDVMLGVGVSVGQMLFVLVWLYGCDAECVWGTVRVGQWTRQCRADACRGDSDSPRVWWRMRQHGADSGWCSNSKHWFTTSFLQPLPYLVTSQVPEKCWLTVFHYCSNSSKFVTNNSNKTRRVIIAADKVCTNINKTTSIWIKTELFSFFLPGWMCLVFT